MQAMKLYEIADEIQSVLNDVLEAEGELTPEMEARLEAVNETFAAKLDATLGWMRTMETMAAGLRDEEKRLAALRKSREKAVERMEGYVLEQLRRADKKRVDTPRFAVSRVLCPPSVRPVSEPDANTLESARLAALAAALRVLIDAPDARWYCRVKVSVEFDAQGAGLWLRSQGVELDEAGDVEVEDLRLSRRERLKR